MIHGQEDTPYGQLGIDAQLDRPDDVQGVCHILHGKIVGLNGHDCLVGGRKCIDSQQIHAMPTIDQDIIVPLLKILQDTGHDHFAGRPAGISATVAATHLQGDQPIRYTGKFRVCRYVMNAVSFDKGLVCKILQFRVIQYSVHQIRQSIF